MREVYKIAASEKKSRNFFIPLEVLLTVHRIGEVASCRHFI